AARAAGGPLSTIATTVWSRSPGGVWPERPGRMALAYARHPRLHWTMISLYTHDDYAALGLAALLDIERIPYRRIPRLAEPAQPWLTALGRALSAAESAAIPAQPALVLTGGAAFAEHLLGTRHPVLDDGAAELPLGEPIWPLELHALAGQFGKRALRVPRAPL